MTGRQLYLALRKRLLLALRGRFFVARRDRNLLFLIDILNYIDREIEAFGAYEKDQLSQFLGRIADRKASLFVDIGANLGLYSLSVATAFPDCEIVAFEPDRRNFGQLHGNLFLNNLQDRVRVEPFALSSAAGQTRFVRHDAENRGRSRLGEDGGFLVEVRRLDDLLPVSGRNIVIKIDVEGHERDVIAGAGRILAENDCLLQVECFAPEALVAQLRDLGYRLVAREGDDLTVEKQRGYGSVPE